MGDTPTEPRDPIAAAYSTVLRRLLEHLQHVGHPSCGDCDPFAPLNDMDWVELADLAELAVTHAATLLAQQRTLVGAVEFATFGELMAHSGI